MIPEWMLMAEMSLEERNAYLDRKIDMINTKAVLSQKLQGHKPPMNSKKKTKGKKKKKR